MTDDASAPNHVFISHSTRDAVVAELCQALSGAGIQVWTDWRRLSPGDDLNDNIRRAIDEARHVVAVLSTNALNSKWVADELRYALSVRDRRGDGFKVVPVLLPGLEPTAVEWLLGDDLVAVRLRTAPGGVQDALPDLLYALGEAEPERAPTAADGAGEVTAAVAELVVELSEPAVEEDAGKRRAVARAGLVYRPADAGGEVRSRPFRFTAPWGAIETAELNWYLERYWRWPSGVFRERARQVEAVLPRWGEELYRALAAADGALADWQRADADAGRQLTIRVDRERLAAAVAEADDRAAADEAATQLLALPWELVRDDEGYLCEGARGVRVRRALPHYKPRPALVTEAPIRVLLVSPRPEDEGTVYIDHRLSARPLVEALDALGELAELEILTPPTFPALKAGLRRARQEKKPFHVVHFDGHGVYDRRHGLGALCFEDPADAEKIDRRRSRIVDAAEIAEALRDFRVPLFFLEACQSARAEEDPTASVAARLLQGGVASVVAMSHSVLVETATRFVVPFYRELMAGRRVGEAMLAGQLALKDDDGRGRSFTGRLRLQDWFVPVLFQEADDPQLIRAVPAARVQAVLERRRQLALGKLPPVPAHAFVGRSRELLRAERLLERERYAVLRGEGGEGKTTLGAELARWLVATRRFDRAAFVSLEDYSDARRVVFLLGDQLLPGFVSQAGPDPGRAWPLVERTLREQRTVIVLDNLESVLPPAAGAPAAAVCEPEVLEELVELFGQLSATASTRLIFTSRQPLPEPFTRNHLTIDRLDRGDAVALVAQVLGSARLTPQAEDEGDSEEEIARLVEAVNGHARSLVLIAREVAGAGVRRATAGLHELMAKLQEKYGDDRERSLFASVELSLRRLPAETRQLIRPLAVFQGGGQLGAIGVVLGLAENQELLMTVAKQLVDVGLGELLPYGYLRLHPALGPALDHEFGVEEREAARLRWADAMVALISFLNQQRVQDAQLAATVTLRDLANVMAVLEYIRETADADRVVGVATRIEGLLANLGRPKALARAAEIRAVAAQELGEWSHARFLAESAAVDRLLEAGRVAEAVAAARAVLERAMAAGENAFPEAAYDIAMAHWELGRTLQMSGAAEAALGPLAEAEGRFRKLADQGDEDAARMASVAVTESGDCLRDLGRMDEAADAYEGAIELAQARKDVRSLAVNKGQLGTVRMFQRRYDQALAAWNEARELFEQLGEPGTVAGAWHQIGRVHEEAQQYEAAEHAYQQSLKIRVERANRSGEALTLNQLGNVYGAMNRLEDAVGFYRQAATIYVELGDLQHEGMTRSNVAVDLIQLQRYAEAREEILRAIECKKTLGHAAEPWKTFMILSNLERAVGNEPAAAQARERAIEAFVAYRRAGGENHNPGGRLAAVVGEAIAVGQVDDVRSQLTELLGQPELPGYLRPLIPALLAVVDGSRDPALASDPDLDYDDAAEILLLLERLG